MSSEFYDFVLNFKARRQIIIKIHYLVHYKASNLDPFCLHSKWYK
jgi:hypothetical protein